MNDSRKKDEEKKKRKKRRKGKAGSGSESVKGGGVPVYLPSRAWQ